MVFPAVRDGENLCFSLQHRGGERDGPDQEEQEAGGESHAGGKDPGGEGGITEGGGERAGAGEREVRRPTSLRQLPTPGGGRGRGRTRQISDKLKVPRGKQGRAEGGPTPRGRLRREVQGL